MIDTVCPQKIRSIGIDTIFDAIFYEYSMPLKKLNHLQLKWPIAEVKSKLVKSTILYRMPAKDPVVGN